MLQIQEIYEEHRSKLKEYFRDGREPVEWEFTPKLVFTRYDQYIQRIEAIVVDVKCLCFQMQ